MGLIGKFFEGFTKGSGEAVAKAAGKLIDWIPGKKEKIRNDIEKYEGEQEQLKKLPATPANVNRMDYVAGKLRELYGKAKNI